MMKDNEWKKLDRTNLPSDILVGDYEFGCQDQENKRVFVSGYQDPITILNRIQRKTDWYYYRKKETPPPTHEEIMTKWWWLKNNVWAKVSLYNSSSEVYNGEPIYIFMYKLLDGKLNPDDDHSFSHVHKDWFIGKKSAELPPEAN